MGVAHVALVVKVCVCLDGSLRVSKVPRKFSICGADRISIIQFNHSSGVNHISDTEMQKMESTAGGSGPRGARIGFLPGAQFLPEPEFF
jgi:hypothetical protein